MTEILENQLHIGLFNKEGLFVLDTENKNFLGKCYLVFPIEEKNHIQDLFEELIFSYNDANSKITSEFLFIFLNLNTEEIIKNSTIYIPLSFFFLKQNIFINNQQVSFRIKNSKKKNKIELAYEILNKSNPNQENRINNKICIDNFSIINTSLVDNLILKLKYNFQDIFWIYKNKDLLVHPVTDINIKIKTVYNNIFQLEKSNLPNYFTYIQNCIPPIHSNLDLYNYSFQKCYNFFDHKQCLTLKAKYIILEQNIKEEFTPSNNFEQIICLKSVAFVEMITDEIYHKLKKCKHLFYCLKFKNKFRNWLWEKVRQKKAQIDFHPTKIIQLLEKGIDILKIEEFLPNG